jgi:hypothetical protein
MSSISPSLARGLAAGLAGGAAWIAAMAAFFGPAQAVLADPDRQSAKFLAVMGQIEPLPRVAGAPWILVAGLIGIACIYGGVYHFVRPAFGRRRWWHKGLGFGAVAWALMVPWFEFYLPWNALHEPVPLVLLEGVLWLAVLLIVGLAIAGSYEWKLEEPAA